MSLEQLEYLEGLDSVWYISIITPTEEYQFPIDDETLPEKFFELIMPGGLINPADVNQIINLNSYNIFGEEIISAKIFKNVLCDLSLFFFRRNIREMLDARKIQLQENLRVAIIQEKDRERQELVRKEKELAEQEKKEIWARKCLKNFNLRCRECQRMLYSTEEIFQTTNMQIILCNLCANIPTKKVCDVTYCRNPVNRSMITGKNHKTCTGCFKSSKSL
tara:strand:- start:69 stop:728 length:660 start_codon:yes stop_codon:yes gene_type:complete